MPRLINLALIYYLPPLVNCFLILGKSPKLFGSATVNDILDPILGRESTSLKNLTLKGAFTAVYSTFFFQRDFGLFY